MTRGTPPCRAVHRGGIALLAGALFGGALLARPAPAEEGHGGGAAPLPEATPLEIPLGVHVVAIRDVDVRAMTFYADLYVWLRYPVDHPLGERLTEFEFANARDVEHAERWVDHPECWHEEIAGQHHWCWHVRGTFSFTPHLQRYPFDRQSLPIVIEHDDLEVHEVRFVDDADSYRRSGVPEEAWGVQPGLEVPEFEVGRMHRVFAEFGYASTFGDPRILQGRAAYSRATFSIGLRRDSLPYFLKIIVPIAVILLMSYLVFWMPVEEFATAFGLAITALLAVIASNVSVAETLPNVGYLVVSDWFFAATYVLLALSMVAIVLLYIAEKRGEDARARIWTRRWRWGYPVLCAGTLGYLALFAALSA
jgi:hypothetical protein